jgi:hypothetical protein
MKKQNVNSRKFTFDKNNLPEQVALVAVSKTKP